MNCTGSPIRYFFLFFFSFSFRFRISIEMTIFQRKKETHKHTHTHTSDTLMIQFYIVMIETTDSDSEYERCSMPKMLCVVYACVSIKTSPYWAEYNRVCIAIIIHLLYHKSLNTIIAILTIKFVVWTVFCNVLLTIAINVILLYKNNNSKLEMNKKQRKKKINRVNLFIFLKVLCVCIWIIWLTSKFWITSISLQKKNVMVTDQVSCWVDTEKKATTTNEKTWKKNLGVRCMNGVCCCPFIISSIIETFGNSEIRIKLVLVMVPRKSQCLTIIFPL